MGRSEAIDGGGLQTAFGSTTGDPEIPGFPDAGRWIQCPTCRRGRGSLCASSLKWGATRGYIGSEVAALHLPVPVKRRRRILTRDEIAAVLPVLRTSDRPHGAAMRFMLLTLTRRQETALARWRDVNMEARTWTIPETKNGEMHVVPLSRQAIDLLRSRLPADDAGNPNRPDPSALIFATSTGAPLGNWDRETKALQEASGTEGWTRHDLRRTGATMLGEMGELPDIIEAALNHVSIRSPLGRDLQPEPLPAAGGGGAATAGGRAGWDRGGSREGSAAARGSLIVHLFLLNGVG